MVTVVKVNGKLQLVVAVEVDKSKDTSMFSNSVKQYVIIDSKGNVVDKTSIDIEPKDFDKSTIVVDGVNVKLDKATRTKLKVSNSQFSTVLSNVTRDKLAIDKVENEVKTDDFTKFIDSAKEKLGIVNAVPTKNLEKIVDKKPILLVGSHGVGKTHTAYQLADKTKRELVYIGIDRGVESVDLRGGVTATKDGLVWMDGVVTEAFRLASSGLKVILMLDELFRANPQELSTLVSALIPDTSGNYVLRTGKAIENTKTGVMTSEVVKAPVENLGIIATTNQGVGYDTETPDLALLDRFFIVEMKSEIGAVTSIISDTISKKGVLSSNIVTKIEALDSELSTLTESGAIRDKFSLRHYSQMVNYSKTNKECVEYLLLMVGNIVPLDSTGYLNEVQHSLVANAIKKHFK